MSHAQNTVIDSKVIFVCGDRSFTGREVIDAALFRGELEPAWKDLLRLLAAERRADEQNLEFDDDAIDTAAEKFRYEHDLITAEETEQWLAERGLNLGDFSAYFVRHYWGDQWEDVEAENLDYFKKADFLCRKLEPALSGRLLCAVVFPKSLPDAAAQNRAADVESVASAALRDYADYSRPSCRTASRR